MTLYNTRKKSHAAVVIQRAYRQYLSTRYRLLATNGLSSDMISLMPLCEVPRVMLVLLDTTQQNAVCATNWHDALMRSNNTSFYGFCALGLLRWLACTPVHPMSRRTVTQHEIAVVTGALQSAKARVSEQQRAHIDECLQEYHALKAQQVDRERRLIAIENTQMLLQEHIYTLSKRLCCGTTTRTIIIEQKTTGNGIVTSVETQNRIQDIDMRLVDNLVSMLQQWDVLENERQEI